MELDWCSEEDLKNTHLFNDNSVISSKTKKQIENDKNTNDINTQKDIIPEDCFDLNITFNKGNTSNISNDLLVVMNYLSCVSNHLRTLIRNKSIKDCDHKIVTVQELESILKYQKWLITTSENVKHFFGNPQRKDNSYDPNSIKPFKTSSYKFCNFKESCSIHRNKNRNCDKNHFVFDMIINDIKKLSESLNTIGLDNLNYVLNNKNLKVTWINDSYIIERFDNYITLESQINNPESEFIVDKNLIFKSFDVASYVLNKMYEESYSFLKYDLNSLQINIK